MEPKRFSSCDGGGSYADELCARAEAEEQAHSGADVILDLVNKVHALTEDLAYAHRRIEHLRHRVDAITPPTAAAMESCSYCGGQGLCADDCPTLRASFDKP